ncbi:MAG: amino acid ABC transporter permease, partial [Chloroflexota bacterium]
PPMGNQYLNLAKNSSLAIAVSYADIFTVMTTIINQTGQSVPGIVMIMVSYLIISLTISFVMNIVNQRFQLVTR